MSLRAQALLWLCSCAAAGCSGDDDGSSIDAGSAEDAGGGGAAGLVVRLDAEAGEAVATAARFVLVELRARNDRGGDLEPFDDSVGLVDVLAGAEIDLAAVPPATYGRVTMRFESGDDGPTALLAFPHSTGTVEVESRDALAVDVRCETPLLLGPGDSGVLALELELEDVWDAVEASGGIDGDVRIDAETDPGRLAVIEDALAVAWSVSCESGVAERAEALDDESL